MNDIRKFILDKLKKGNYKNGNFLAKNIIPFLYSGNFKPEEINNELCEMAKDGYFVYEPQTSCGGYRILKIE